jgi:GTPase SAR1 family protein
MGCSYSKKIAPAEESEVDNYLKEEQVRALTRFKVLLLGAGESGKSTVIKQLRILHKVTLSEHEITQYRIALHDNSLRMIKKFIEAAAGFGIQWDNQQLVTLASQVKAFELDRNQLYLTPEIATMIATLWNSTTLQKVAQRRNEFWNLDASDYYFENVSRFVEPDFIPNEEDCIMARVITTGIAVTEFDEGAVHFSVVDVGGQRSERKKWIHCFDDVKAIIFVVSLAGYNQVMYEDESHNRYSLLLYIQLMSLGCTKSYIYSKK